MTDIVERLEAGVPEVGLHEDNNTELFDIEASNDTMFEAAVEIRRLRDHLIDLADAADNVLKSQAGSASMSVLRRRLAAYRASEKG